MRNRFQSLPVDNDVYKLISDEAGRTASTRTNVMNGILRAHYGLAMIEVDPKQFNPVVNLKSKVAKSTDREVLGELANKVLREAKKL